MARYSVRCRFQCFCFGFSFLLAHPVLAGDLPSMPSAMGGDTSIVPTVRSSPNYPAEALASEREGWAFLSFALVPGGGTDDLIALRSSDAAFEVEAIKAVSRWKYALPEEGPGSSGGSLHTAIRFTFDRRNNRTPFMSIYQGIEPLLDQGQLAEALARLPRAYEKIQTLMDDGMYHWLVYRIASANDAPLVAADALDAMEPVFRFLPNDVLIAALEARIALAIENGELRRARNYIDWMRLNEDLKAVPSYADFMQGVNAQERMLAARLASSEPVSVAARNFHRYWTHALNYSEFALGEVCLAQFTGGVRGGAIAFQERR